MKIKPFKAGPLSIEASAEIQKLLDDVGSVAPCGANVSHLMYPGGESLTGTDFKDHFETFDIVPSMREEDFKDSRGRWFLPPKLVEPPSAALNSAILASAQPAGKVLITPEVFDEAHGKVIEDRQVGKHPALAAPYEQQAGRAKRCEVCDGKGWTMHEHAGMKNPVHCFTCNPSCPEPASAQQVGGSHYKDLAIQPAEYCHKNGLSYCESMAVKYISRHKSKNGKEDLEKAIHCLRMLIGLEYGGDTNDN